MGEPADGGRSSGLPIVAVLAGGRGNRIGGSKALAELAGRPLISYPLAAAEAAGLEPLVVAKPDSELPPLSCRLIEEPMLPLHPLCGILAALRQAGQRPLVAIGCDMPFAGAELLSWLGSLPEPLAAPVIDGELQPLLARYDGELLPALEAALERAEPLRRTVEGLRPRLIPEAELARFGDPRRLCFNVNAPADLERAGQMLGPQVR